MPSCRLPMRRRAAFRGGAVHESPQAACMYFHLGDPVRVEVAEAELPADGASMRARLPAFRGIL